MKSDNLISKEVVFSDNEKLSKNFYKIGYEKIVNNFSENEYESYVDFGIEIGNLTIELLSKISTGIESEIFKKRMAIIDCDITTEEYISREYNLSKNEVKYIIIKIENNLKKYKVRYIKILNEIADKKILNYLVIGLFNIYNLEFVKLIFNIIDENLSKLIVRKIITYTHPNFNREYQNINELENIIYNLIKFPKSDKENYLSDFYSLYKQRDTYDKNNNGKIRINSVGSTLDYESLKEKQLLEMFGHFTFVKAIKTQSLYISYLDGNSKKRYYPDIQILTKDNKLVIVEVKPYYHMMDREVIKKYAALKRYCEKYGYGYLIIDEYCDTYENIAQINVSKSIEEEFINFVKLKGEIDNSELKKFKAKTGVKTKEIVKIVLDNYDLLDCSVGPLSIKYITQNQ